MYQPFLLEVQNEDPAIGSTFFNFYNAAGVNEVNTTCDQNRMFSPSYYSLQSLCKTWCASLAIPQKRAASRTFSLAPMVRHPFRVGLVALYYLDVVDSVSGTEKRICAAACSGRCVTREQRVGVDPQPLVARDSFWWSWRAGHGLYDFPFCQNNSFHGGQSP